MDYKDLSLCNCGWVYPTVAGKCSRCGNPNGVPITVGLNTDEAISAMDFWIARKKRSDDQKKGG